MVGSSDKTRNVRHGTPKIASQVPSIPDFWTWTCCSCVLASGMKTTNNPKCTECHHPRCKYCEVEVHYFEDDHNRSNFPSAFKSSKVLADQASQPRRHGRVPRNTTSRPSKRSKSRLQPTSEQQCIFACPFHKKDPCLYNQFTEPDPVTRRDHFQCTKKGWPEIKNLVKDHLRKVHRPPECLICHMHHFDTEPHHRASASRNGIMDDEQWKQILVLLGCKKTSHGDKWNGIWHVLFPGTSPPTNSANENPWARPKASMRDIDILVTELLNFPPLLQEYLSQGTEARQACLNLHTELTEALSYSIDSFNDSLDHSSSSINTLHSTNILTTRPALTASSDMAETMIPYSSTSFQNPHSQLSMDYSRGRHLYSSQNICDHHPLSDDNNSLDVFQASWSDQPVSVATIFNPSETLTISTSPYLPPLPSPVLVPETTPFAQKIFLGRAALDVEPDQRALEIIFDHAYFRTTSLPTDVYKLDESDCRHPSLSWEALNSDGNEAGQSGFDRSPVTGQFTTDLDSDNESSGALTPWKNKNDGNQYVQNRKIMK